MLVDALNVIGGLGRVSWGSEQEWRDERQRALDEAYAIAREIVTAEPVDLAHVRRYCTAVDQLHKHPDFAMQDAADETAALLVRLEAPAQGADLDIERAVASLERLAAQPRLGIPVLLDCIDFAQVAWFLWDGGHAELALRTERASLPLILQFEEQADVEGMSPSLRRRVARVHGIALLATGDDAAGIAQLRASLGSGDRARVTLTCAEYLVHHGSPATQEFLDLALAQYERRLAAGLESEEGQDGWNRRVGKVRGMLAEMAGDGE